MVLYQYQCPFWGDKYIAFKQQDIVDTVLETERRTPTPKNLGPASIYILKHVDIGCTLPLANPQRYLYAPVREECTFKININALEFALQQTVDLKRIGKLYWFNQGAGIWNWYLPKAFMNALREYDWNQHAEHIRKWHAEHLLQRTSSNIKVLD